MSATRGDTGNPCISAYQLAVDNGFEGDEAAKERKRSEIAAARWAEETAGIDGIKTDRESQALITGAALQAVVDPDYTCRWKTETRFIELGSLQIKGIAQAVRLHVQGCFDREAELLPLIEAAESPEELAAISY